MSLIKGKLDIIRPMTYLVLFADNESATYRDMYDLFDCCDHISYVEMDHINHKYLHFANIDAFQDFCDSHNVYDDQPDKIFLNVRLHVHVNLNYQGFF